MDILTLRQKEVIQCLRAGMSNKEIANELSISENTVEYHLKKIYTTLGVNRRIMVLRCLDAKETTDSRS